MYIDIQNGANTATNTQYRVCLNAAKADVATKLGTGNVGSTTRPIYLSAGSPVACGSSLGVNITGNAATATTTNTITGGTKLTSDTVDSFLDTNKLQYALADTTVITGNDGCVLSLGWSGSYGAQIWMDDGSSEGGMQIRNHASSGWHPWRQVLTSGNYNTYSPTLTGSGASGTWGINITGNAATATKLQTVRTISLTGDVTGSGTFDGSNNLSITTTVADNSHNHNASNITAGTLGTARGGTGNNSFTANRMLYTESATKFATTNHYVSTSKVAINSTSAPTAALHVSGDANITNSLFLNSAVKFTYNSTDKCVDVIFV